jgi:hypothetical protein
VAAKTFDRPRVDPQLAEHVIEPAAGAADHEDPLRLESKGSVERELEIARLLRRRISLHPLERSETLRRDRIEVPHRQIDGHPERVGEFHADVCADHHAARRQLDRHRFVRSAREHYDNGAWHP